MAFNVNSITPMINNWDKAATKFFHPSVANPGNIQILGNGFKGAATESTRKAGYYLNQGTYNVANKAGDKLISTMANSSSKVGSYLMKVPGLDKVANGLSKLGKAGGSKLPGIGTILALATSVLGIGKSVSLAAKGDGAGAGHKLLSTAGTVGGIMAGAALMMTGVGFLPGLALAIGAGVAGDWAGKKAGDLVFGQVDSQTGHSASYIQKQTATQQTAQNPFYSQENMAGGSNEEFDKYVNSLIHNPGLR